MWDKIAQMAFCLVRDHGNRPGACAPSGSGGTGTAASDGATRLSKLSGTIDGVRRFSITLTPVDRGGLSGTLEGTVATEAGSTTSHIMG